ncbi:MAG TPA: hypothetical protein P5052_03985 [Candidatus Paceibacterota bacterium]|nr:hypothetical protein [Candidatus Paceibacterota bacterium]
MKKITIGLCIFLLSFNFVYAQTASVSDNIFTNIASTIANA